MRLGTTALVASAVTGLLYLTMPTASALPAAPRSDVTTAKTANLTQEVRHRRRGYRRWGYRPYRYYDYGPYYYRPYRYYGYSPYYYRPYPYYYGGGYYPYYYRRPGFGIYLGF